jgi:hypothetical protein
MNKQVPNFSRNHTGYRTHRPWPKYPGVSRFRRVTSFGQSRSKSDPVVVKPTNHGSKDTFFQPDNTKAQHPK